MNVHKIIATGLGIGYIRKGGGTVAAAACGVLWYFAFAGGAHPVIPLLITLIITAIGIWSANEVESDWGVDSHRVVIDEIAGMCISLVFVPVRVAPMVAAFVLFRFFDIRKPGYIRQAEKLQGGWGVMADDILAGICSNVLVQVAVQFSVL